MIAMPKPNPAQDMKAAHLANRIRYARARHSKWIAEMRAWGYVITEPAVLTPPAEK